MRAMVLDSVGGPLRMVDLPMPNPGAGQVCLRVRACGVCRTDLHILDGDLSAPTLPTILGHQIVGSVEHSGPGAARFAPGQRIGVPWLGWTDDTCPYCRTGRENVCDNARFVGF